MLQEDYGRRIPWNLLQETLKSDLSYSHDLSKSCSSGHLCQSFSLYTRNRESGSFGQVRVTIYWLRRPSLWVYDLAFLIDFNNPVYLTPELLILLLACLRALQSVFWKNCSWDHQLQSLQVVCCLRLSETTLSWDLVADFDPQQIQIEFQQALRIFPQSSYSCCWELLALSYHRAFLADFDCRTMLLCFNGQKQKIDLTLLAEDSVTL